MKLLTASTFYRPAFDVRSPVEDGAFINPQTKLFGVADGVSAAYSPSHPPLRYGPLTGGQMVVRELNSSALLHDQSCKILPFIHRVNRRVLANHKKMGQKPGTDNVGGASFAICQIGQKEITFVLAGDCFVLCRDDQGLHFWTGLDLAAYLTEQRADEVFAECLSQTDGDRGRAWDLYYPLMRAGKIRFANRLIGHGGFAELNGDPALETCCRIIKIGVSLRPRFILLGTDGMIPSQAFKPVLRRTTMKMMEKLYLKGGLTKILQWRDGAEKSLHHLTGWPEASAVELEFEP